MENHKKMNKKGLSFVNLLIYGLLIMIFSVGMITFGVQLASDNNANSTILSEPAISQAYTSLNSTIVESTSTLDSTDINSINSQREGFFSGIPVLEGVEATLTTIFGVIPNLFSLIIDVYDLVISIISTSIGVPPIFLNLMSGIIVLLGIFLAWRVYKAGE